MNQPTFQQIWTTDGWTEFWSEFRPIKTQTYYQVRSIIRMAVWIPIAYITVVGWMVILG